MQFTKNFMNKISIKSKLISEVWVWLSILVASLVTTTSLFGILDSKTYSRETSDWAIQAIGQDYTNLVVMIILLWSSYFAHKDSVRAFLVWLGCYIYLTYAFAIYAFAVHFQFLLLIYILILGLSFYTLTITFLTLKQENFQNLLFNSRIKIISGFLIFVASLFTFLWLSEIVPYLFSGFLPPTVLQTQLLVNPVHVLDLAFLLPAMFMTAILLWRKNIWGYILVVPLLVFAATMGLGILAIFIISFLKGLPFSPVPALAVSIIIILSLYFSYLFLREIPENE